MRQAYNVRKRTRQASGFYNLMKAKKGGQPIEFAQLQFAAALSIQTGFRALVGYREGLLRRERKLAALHGRAALVLQCNWRVHRDRQTVKKLSNMLKMRRLARFWLDMCVTKCYLRWCKFAVTSREEKKVLRKVVHRMMYKGVLQAFNKLADHAEEQRFKRPAAQKVLGFLSSHKDGARNEMWDRWRDAVDETRETHRRAAERLLGFAVNSSLAARA